MMDDAQNQLVPLIMLASRQRRQRREILRAFEAALRHYSGPRPDAWWWIFSGLQVDAALYEPDPSKFHIGMVDESRMEEILMRAASDLATAGFDVSEAVQTPPVEGT
jgi:hypothetical protein